MSWAELLRSTAETHNYTFIESTMSPNSGLKSLESACITVDDSIAFALQVLEEAANQGYATYSQAKPRRTFKISDGLL